VVLGALAVWMFRKRDLSRGELLGASLMLAGGIGNLIDRVFRDGTVIDFLHLGTAQIGTGIFNVADVAITAGVAVLAIVHFRTPKDRSFKFHSGSS
jgi:signal peptidase II